MADAEVLVEAGEGGPVGDVDMAESELAATGVNDSGLQDIETESQPRKSFLE